MKNLITPFALLFTAALSAQEPISILHGCNFIDEETEKEYYTFEASNEADKIVKRILDAAGSLSHKSLIVKESNVKNALATTEGKDRYILYSTAFLEKFKGDAKTKWAAYTVLAHEIGHHLNGHDFAEEDTKIRKKMELEADNFAGAVCRTLGASLQEALAGMESMELAGETSTHPAKSARTAAVANGWKKQDEILGPKPVEPDPVIIDKNPEVPPIIDKTPADGTDSNPPEFIKKTNITIVYTGDPYGCVLQHTMIIGGVQFVPMNNSFTVYNVPVGLQQYQVSGTNSCPTLGACTASGAGWINVLPGGVYNVQWNITAYAQCTVQLVGSR
jgi:hypothetical protein